jgi:hypothetical protein
MQRKLRNPFDHYDKQEDHITHALLVVSDTNRNAVSAAAAIPDELLFNKHDHRKKYPGDNGIRLKKIKNK